MNCCVETPADWNTEINGHNLGTTTYSTVGVGTCFLILAEGQNIVMW